LISFFSMTMKIIHFDSDNFVCVPKTLQI
jgi:hypothetical protein